jgi:anthranilate phosphoribosyltransferase
MKAIPTSSKTCFVWVASSSITAPSASRTSAEPTLEDAERLLCLMMGTPAPATTKAAVVEILNVPDLSPPVPTKSTAFSNVGSADVLEALGAVIELDATQTKQVFEEVGMAFMFAPMFHPGMKYVMPARRQLGFRTFFNILGPMVNPAGVNRYVIGAYSEYVAQNMMQILTKLGVTRAFTFHSADGLDELSVTAPSTIFEFDGSRQKASFEFMPQDLGFERSDFRDLIGGTRADNARILTEILKNESNQARKDIVALNAAFGIHASGYTTDIHEARNLAGDSIESGKAYQVFSNYLQATQDIAAS